MGDSRLVGVRVERIDEERHAWVEDDVPAQRLVAHVRVVEQPEEERCDLRKAPS